MPPKFQVIPSIDILDGKVVRLYQGKYDRSTVYDADPVEQACTFVEAGAFMIHLIDLDAARSGNRQTNHKIIQKMAGSVKKVNQQVQVELGGGLRDEAALQESFALGVDRCILGTAAVKDPSFLERAIKEHGPERIIVGVDVQDDLVQIAGWEEASLWKVSDFLQSLESKGVQEVIMTDISRDGTLEGPGNAILGNYIKECDLRFILSGGVSSLQDLELLLAARHPRLVGAISGRAIYENTLDLKRAVALCEASPFLLY